MGVPHINGNVSERRINAAGKKTNAVGVMAFDPFAGQGRWGNQTQTMIIGGGKHNGTNPAVKGGLAQLVPQGFLNHLPLVLIQRNLP
jgi:hypothetical protein